LQSPEIETAYAQFWLGGWVHSKTLKTSTLILTPGGIVLIWYTSI